ncbi:hypothetical protein PanWU01x14_233490 [Parasponia andersonii]|uniref:Cytochrome P n=1 Tax=Parasponia andersonii TaxID=3476 RepID=A0A2P5BJI6_PARAD|nr:hypothetical protein PanWU01x14_233490 [Parasponia andersonii]
MAFCSYGESWRQARRIYALQLFSLRRVQFFQSVGEEETAVVSRDALLGRGMTPKKVPAGELGVLSKRLVVQLVAFCFGDFFPFFEMDR